MICIIHVHLILIFIQLTGWNFNNKIFESKETTLNTLVREKKQRTLMIRKFSDVIHNQVILTPKKERIKYHVYHKLSCALLFVNDWFDFIYYDKKYFTEICSQFGRLRSPFNKSKHFYSYSVLHNNFQITSIFLQSNMQETIIRILRFENTRTMPIYIPTQWIIWKNRK